MVGAMVTDKDLKRENDTLKAMMIDNNKTYAEYLKLKKVAQQMAEALSFIKKEGMPTIIRLKLH